MPISSPSSQSPSQRARTEGHRTHVFTIISETLSLKRGTSMPDVTLCISPSRGIVHKGTLGLEL